MYVLYKTYINKNPTIDNINNLIYVIHKVVTVATNRRNECVIPITTTHLIKYLSIL